MSDQNGLLEKRGESKRLIHTLEATLVPEKGLELFTVGDSFRMEVNRLENELISLAT